MSETAMEEYDPEREHLISAEDIDSDSDAVDHERVIDIAGGHFYGTDSLRITQRDHRLRTDLARLKPPLILEELLIATDILDPNNTQQVEAARALINNAYECLWDHEEKPKVTAIFNYVEGLMHDNHDLPFVRAVEAAGEFRILGENSADKHMKVRQLTAAMLALSSDTWVLPE